MKAPDEVLVERAQFGDQDALCELLTAYEKRTYNLALRLMGNHADACDAAQEALVRVYTRLHHFRGDSQFSTWLFRVVTNTCLDELRRRGRLRAASLDQPMEMAEGELTALPPTQEDGPVEWAERHELQAAVQRAIGRLPAEYRIVVVLRDLQDFTYQEIADSLGTSLGTVKSRLHRARLALRSIIQATEARSFDLVALAG